MPEGNRDDCVAIFKLDNLIVRVSRSYAQPYAAYLFNCPKLRPGAKLSSTAQARFSQVKSAAVLLLLLLLLYGDRKPSAVRRRARTPNLAQTLYCRTSRSADGADDSDCFDSACRMDSGGCRR